MYWYKKAARQGDHVDILEYLQIIIDAKRMVEVSEASQEEARLLIEQL